ncbi:hypothetical protein Clacol_003755 [Clathrus columnatus]|uniref:NUDE domain-containing protein n=1 Tax=Clathrus columnatus TaxID=1419009 RepID=A0AAV5A796_9AGAM|nr:hypothetical protein Clacol_003755 [Clathrus columnatus]
MAAVLSPASNFKLPLSSEEDAYDQDWKQKYFDLQETLAATRADLEDFQLSSKELEEEMTLEIERTEKVQQELSAKVARVESERDEWKSKFVTLQTTHNTTTTSLQREIDTLRQQHQKYKVQLRELEIGNDDLERNERAVLSSLADVETKYSRVLEEKILLEQELLDKASLEEKTQRLKDELRGKVLFNASEEISNLRRLLDEAENNSTTHHTTALPESGTGFSLSDNDHNAVKATSTDLQLSDLVPEVSDALDDTVRLPPKASSRDVPQQILPSTPSYTHSLRPVTSSIPPRSSGLPVLSPQVVGSSRGQTSTRSLARPPAPSGHQSLATKSKGVQMISALRSRVQTTQQRLIPGIPRLRLGSTTGRTVPPGPVNTTRSSTDSKRSGSLTINETPPNHVNGIDRGSGAHSPGWVLIQTQDDSPYPSALKQGVQGRSFSPISPTTPSVTNKHAYNHRSVSTTTSGIPRRPPSRLSLTGTDESPTTQGGRLSAGSSSIALSSRPTTPTFLPVPTPSLLKSGKSIENAPSSFVASMYNPRRLSLEAGRSKSPYPESTTTMSSTRMMAVSTRDRPTSVPVPPRTSFSSSSRPVSGRTSALGKSRIGKPSRRNTGGELDEPPPVPFKEKRGK